MEQCSADSAIDAVDASRIPQPARTEDAIQHPNIHFHISHRGSRLEAPKPQRPGRDFNSLDDTQQPHVRMRSSITIPTPVSIDFSPSVLDASALPLGERPPMRRQSTLGAGTKVPSLLQPGPRAADEKAASSTYAKQLPKHDKPLPPVPQVDAAHLRLQTQLARPDGPQRAHTFDTSSLSPKRNPTTRYTEFMNDISAKIDPTLPPYEHYETKRYLVHHELRAMGEYECQVETAEKLIQKKQKKARHMTGFVGLENVEAMQKKCRNIEKTVPVEVNSIETSPVKDEVRERNRQQSLAALTGDQDGI